MLIHVTRNNYTQKVIDTPQFLQVHPVYIEEYAKRIRCTHELQKKKKEDARNCNIEIMSIAVVKENFQRIFYH